MILGLESWIFWLILIVLFSVVEIATSNLVTVWFAVGSLVALIAGLCGGSVALQIIISVVVSGLTLAFILVFKPFRNLRGKDAVPTNYDRVIGMEAVVTEEIDGVMGKGQVIVGGQVWSALPEITDERIRNGETVYIKRVSGVKLIVSRNKEDL